MRDGGGPVTVADEPTLWDTVRDQIDALIDVDPATLARSGDPATSRTAAHRLRTAATRRRRLLAAYATGDRTAEEAARVAGYTPADGAWKRVSDLKRLGYIAPTGRTRPGSSGRDQEVLAITDAGRAVVGDG